MTETTSPTAGFTLNHTMLRVTDPSVSLAFYTEVLGLNLLHRLDFDEMEFSLYFLGYQQPVEGTAARTRATFGQPGVLELTHNWGTENDPDFAGYHDGNAPPQGFGHIAISVPDVDAACARFEELGVAFVKRPNDGKMKGIAFIKDPDGYWIEILSVQSLIDLQGA